MARLGIISEHVHVHVFPKKGKKDYYCLYWGFAKSKDFKIGRAFSFGSHQKLQGPQELTTWQD